MKLKGITWDHERGYPPLLAVSEEFEKKNPLLSYCKIQQCAQHGFNSFLDRMWALSYDGLLHLLKNRDEEKVFNLSLGDLENLCLDTVGYFYQDLSWKGTISGRIEGHQYIDKFKRMRLNNKSQWGRYDCR